MSVSPFDHPWLSGLLGDDTIATQFSPGAEIGALLHFEAALAHAEGAEGVIPADAAAMIVERIPGLLPDFAKVRTAAARDGVIVPELVRQLRERVGAPHDQFVHFGATSQDVLDTSLLLRLKPVLGQYADRLRRLVAQLGELEQRFGTSELMGRTRMQDALPIRVSDRIAAWRGPLQRDLDRLAALSPQLLMVQFGGAAGTLDNLGDKGPAVARRLAARLELGCPERAWHSQRDTLAAFADWLALLSGSLGKLGADVALMAQNAIAEVALAGGGTSSAMPHKQNPVAAEILVTLAHYNATLVGGMHNALIHEQERSGVAWTLEWLVLPQMVMTTAAGLRTALTLCGQITRLGR